MSAASALYISGCKDHPGTTDLSCCRIRRADGTPLDIREVWAVIQKMEADSAELEEQRRELLAACKAMIAAFPGVSVMPTREDRAENAAREQARKAIASAEATHE